MGLGHLDFETGKWIDDPKDKDTGAADDGERAVDVGDDGLVRPSGAAAAAPPPPSLGAEDPSLSVIVGDDGLARRQTSAAPLSPVQRAKLIQVTQSGTADPATVASARALLGMPPAPSASPPPPAQNVPLSPAQRAIILRSQMRNPTPGVPPGPLAMNPLVPPQGVQ